MSQLKYNTEVLQDPSACHHLVEALRLPQFQRALQKEVQQLQRLDTVAKPHDPHKISDDKQGLITQCRDHEKPELRDLLLRHPARQQILKLVEILGSEHSDLWTAVSKIHSDVYGEAASYREELGLRLHNFCDAAFSESKLAPLAESCQGEAGSVNRASEPEESDVKEAEADVELEDIDRAMEESDAEHPEEEVDEADEATIKAQLFSPRSKSSSELVGG
eukprot:TRINITY_DN26776_c1_g1_i1.p1 TRINITY_DN26776_c1_g1~~TRINITY_DN26776_c1_g1_i1.p1  ORF type:complete len:257 (+),score=55.97 TRINITY_DN26776_c1_g1_i1:114-773(+)